MVLFEWMELWDCVKTVILSWSQAVDKLTVRSLLERAPPSVVTAPRRSQVSGSCMKAFYNPWTGFERDRYYRELDPFGLGFRSSNFILDNTGD